MSGSESIIFLDSGTQTILQGSSTKYTVQTTLENPAYTPVISLTAVGEYANIESWLGTTIEYDTTLRRWVFTIHDSISEAAPGLHEPIDIMWKAVAVFPVQEIGHNGALDIEP